MKSAPVFIFFFLFNVTVPQALGSSLGHSKSEDSDFEALVPVNLIRSPAVEDTIVVEEGDQLKKMDLPGFKVYLKTHPTSASSNSELKDKKQ